MDRSRARGVTLIEIMIVVAIIGVLAALAGVGYARWTTTAKMAEATNMIGAIKNGQENYFSQAGRYLDVSKGLEPPHLYPVQTPGAKKVQWGGECSWCTSDFRRLGVKADGAVFFGYATVADSEKTPDGRGASFSTSGGAVDWVKENGGAAITKPWFIATAHGDTNGNGIYAKVAGSSFNSRLIVDREGE